MSNNESQNVYAKNIEGTPIHVSGSDSGRKGYYCLGCDHEMEAVRHKATTNRIDYFRHVALDVTIERKCTYRDETYRHKLAKEILQRLKSIKVPTLYKYPPSKEEGIPNLMEESRFITAHSVGIEKTFFEDENGVIRYGANNKTNIEDRFLVVRPDVTFFNSNKEPILFIEIVATHGVNNEKRNKLKRLGIDTVQIKVPKDSPESIEASFKRTNLIKWIYNNAEERTEYIPIPKEHSEGIPSIDEQQRRLFEESYSCRASQINNLIRTIGRCLASEQYRESSEGLRAEISRVSSNTAAHQTRLEELQTEHRKSVETRFEGEFRELEKQKSEFELNIRDLEDRYYTKRAELERQDQQLEQRVQREVEENSGTRENFQLNSERNLKDRDRIIERIGDQEREIELDTKQILEHIGEEEKYISEDIQSRETIQERFREIENSTRREFERKEKFEIGEIERIQREEDGESINLERRRDELNRKYQNFGEQSSNAVANRIINENTELSRRIRDIIQTSERLHDIPERIASYKRYRQAWQCFKSGAYKNWND